VTLPIFQISAARVGFTSAPVVGIPYITNTYNFVIISIHAMIGNIELAYVNKKSLFYREMLFELIN
jgi:hypothetical protein